MAFDATSAVGTILFADATLTGMLATFQSVAGIFLGDPIPPGAARPYIHSVGNVSLDQIAQHLDRRFLPDVARDIGCYTDRSGDPALVDQIADRVHALFFGNGSRVGTAPSWSGGGMTLLETDVLAGPIPAPTDENVRGRIITVRLAFRPT